MALDAAIRPTLRSVIPKLKRAFEEGLPPVPRSYGHQALLTVRRLGLFGGVAFHLLLGLTWSWLGGLVVAGAFALYAITIAPAITRLRPHRPGLHLITDSVTVALVATLVGTPVLAIPWLFVLFLAPMVLTGTRTALAVLAAAGLLVPFTIGLASTDIQITPTLDAELQIAYMYIAFAGDVLIAIFLTLTMGVATRAAQAERAQAAETVERQRSHLETLFEAIPTPVAQFDMKEVATRLSALRRHGVDHATSYLNDHPEICATLVETVVVERANLAWCKLFGLDTERARGRVNRDRLPPGITHAFEQLVGELAAGKVQGGFRLSFETFQGAHVHGWFGFRVVETHGNPDYSRVIVTAVDETEREELVQTINERNAALARALEELQTAQAEMLQGQKMEAIGTLAAGIAHEINTPIQYVGDNVRFIGDAVTDVIGILQASGQAVAEFDGGTLRPETVSMLSQALDEADVDFLYEELPAAVDQALEGVDRVATIVRAMKDFAHPGTEELAPVDLNAAIETTATVSKNEWKYVAELELDLDPDLGLVPALSGPLNQVVLNLIVNAAHAIADKGDDKGVIRIVTAREDDFAVISISDTGCGIPEKIRNRIFEPFFTTKEVGRGSGQGLALAHRVVVERHRGRIDVDSEVGVGTTFHLRIPLHPEEEN